MVRSFVKLYVVVCLALLVRMVFWPVAVEAATLTSLYSFCTRSSNAGAPETPACLDGTTPSSQLLQIGNQLYGTTTYGGSGNQGTLFSISTTGVFKTLHNFCPNTESCSDGALPGQSLALGANGDIYGVTTTGGGNGIQGVLFKISPGGAFTTIHQFCSKSACVDGATPVSVVSDSKGDLYGTTVAGGLYRDGTVFKLAGSGKFQILYNFCSAKNCTDGVEPGPLVLGRGGMVFGTTGEGGANQAGTVFRMTPAGALTTLHAFCAQKNCTDGAQPNSPLVEDKDGNFYGTTARQGGSANVGTIFRINYAGALTTLHSFCAERHCPDGENAGGGLTLASDGSLYGAAVSGGVYYNGLIYNITTAGKYSIVYDFCSLRGCFDGTFPTVPPTIGTDGKLYGTTAGGGNKDNVGTIYKLTP